MNEEAKPRLSMDSNLRVLDKRLKLVENLEAHDIAYLQAPLAKKAI